MPTCATGRAARPSGQRRLRPQAVRARRHRRGVATARRWRATRCPASAPGEVAHPAPCLWHPTLGTRRKRRDDAAPDALVADRFEKPTVCASMAAAWRRAACSTSGGASSSGVRNSPARRVARPAVDRLPQTESGIPASKPTMIGESQIGNGAPLAWMAAIHSSASIVCTPCRSQASRHEVGASPRGGDFQSSRHPVSAPTRNWLWNSMRTGASSSECRNSRKALAKRFQTPPNDPARRLHERHQERQRLGRQQQHPGQSEERQDQLQVRRGPDREQLVGLEKIDRHVVRVAREQQGRQQQEPEPQRRRGVRQHAGDEHAAMDRVQLRLEQQARVLQVPVAPAAVALQFRQQVRRHLLVAAVQGRPRSRPSSRHGASVRPRRSHATGPRPRGTPCRAAAPGRNGP